jgi:hypothetical protein
MCKAAAKTAAALMAAIEPTIKSLLTATGQINTPDGIAAIKAYDDAVTALDSWTSGTPAQEVLELIADFQAALNVIPIPPQFQVLLNIVLAGVETVIGVLTANSPAPTDAASAVAPHEETQTMHALAVADDTTAKVQALVPGFKRSIFHSPESQYTKAWNDAVDAHPELGVAKV